MKTSIVLAAAGAAALAISTTAHAEDQPWAFRTGPAQVTFSTSAEVAVAGAVVPGGGASASSNTTLGFELSYDHSSRLTTRLLAGIPPKTTLSGEGALVSAGTLGKVTYAPAVLSLTYRLLDDGPVRPYVGAGLNYTIVMNEDDGFISGLKVRNAFGSVVEIGAEVPIDKQWFFSIDARKIFLRTTADGTLPAFGGASTHARVRLDPLVVLAAVGWRF